MPHACAPYTCAHRPCADVECRCNVTWQGFIDLHKAVGQRLHADFAAGAYGVQPMVCGPTTAWPEFQATDFGTFNDLFAPFIAEAGPDLDCISTHLYDAYGTMDHIDETDVSWRTGSNLEAVLDLMEAYEQSTIGKVLPHLISEMGALWTGSGSNDGHHKVVTYFPRHDWQLLER